MQSWVMCRLYQCNYVQTTSHINAIKCNYVQTTLHIIIIISFSVSSFQSLSSHLYISSSYYPPFQHPHPCHLPGKPSSSSTSSFSSDHQNTPSLSLLSLPQSPSSLSDSDLEDSDTQLHKLQSLSPLPHTLSDSDLEEGDAQLHKLGNLEHLGLHEEFLHCGSPYVHAASVDEAQDLLEDGSFYLFDLNDILATLFHARGKHGAEVGGTCCQDHLSQDQPQFSCNGKDGKAAQCRGSFESRS